MSLHLYDTLRRESRVFQPLVAGEVSIYVCGPTVQAEPHVGHVRSAVVFDVLRRWLTASGYRVTLARNVTDIDDKILHSAGHEGTPWWALAERNTRAFTAAYDALGVLPPTVAPRATGHVPEMVALIARILAAGAAYSAGGDVYFDVGALPSYGRLSGQRTDALLVAEPDAAASKRNPLDFALWKGAKPGEPAWDTPWGAGRPGWHLECSAMATRYLGAEFDIHGGGLDLVFPHHENELAQSTAAGDPFARWWMHHGLVNVGADKMSKSLGNSLFVADVLAEVPPVVLRYYLAAPHYRSAQTWSAEGVAEAEAAYGRIETFVRNATERLGGDPPPVSDGAGKAVWDGFAAAMDDDLATPRALSAVHAAVRNGNAALAGAGEELPGWLAVVRQMLTVLGLEPISQWPAAGASLQPVVDALAGIVVQARQEARERRDFAAADALRDALAGAGVIVEDVAGGARWRLANR
ncbi:MAG: cysteine--tRNA ligase [Frankiaceae bacterium]